MKEERARGVTKDGRPIFSEEHEHIIVADWLRVHRIQFIHVPNGGMRNKVVAIKLKRMGVTPGVPDFLIFTPPKKLGFAHAALELKALDGDRPGTAQSDFLQMLSMWHWAVTWCRGSDSAIRWLQTLY